GRHRNFASSEKFRTGSENASTLLNNSRRLWLNRKFFTGLLISPFSTRKVPSLVMPVTVLVRGSVSRTYQNLVISSPLSRSPISSSEFLVAPLPRITRLVGSSPRGFGRGSS